MNQQKVVFLNKGLFVIVIALIIYLGINVILIFNPKEEYRVKVSKRNHEILSIESSSHIQHPISYYKEVSLGRLFISPIAPSPPEVKESPEKELVVSAPIEITFQLIGITWGEKGANALIKSSQEPQIRLVNIGDEISGYQVVDITKEGVILKKGNNMKVVRLEE
ncbi:MAG: hypothetical protein AB1567_06295 [bacterium]